MTCDRVGPVTEADCKTCWGTGGCKYNKSEDEWNALIFKQKEKQNKRRSRMENDKLLMMSYIKVWEEFFEPYLHFERITPLFQEVELSDNIVGELTPFESQLFKSIPTPGNLDDISEKFHTLENLNQTSAHLAALIWNYIQRKRGLFRRGLSVKIRNGILYLVERKE